MIQNHTSNGSPFIGGLIMVVIGFAFLFFLGGTETFSCSRISNICSSETTNFISSKKNVIYTVPIESIVEAKINSERGSKGAMNYSLSLQTNQGVMPVSSYSSSDYSGMQSRASKINNFLKSSNMTLQVKDEKIMIRVICIFFIIIGFLLLWSSFLSLLKIIFALFLYVGKK